MSNEIKFLDFCPIILIPTKIVGNKPLTIGELYSIMNEYKQLSIQGGK